MGNLEDRIGATYSSPSARKGDYSYGWKNLSDCCCRISERCFRARLASVNVHYWRIESNFREGDFYNDILWSSKLCCRIWCMDRAISYILIASLVDYLGLILENRMIAIPAMTSYDMSQELLSFLSQIIYSQPKSTLILCIGFPSENTVASIIVD